MITLIEATVIGYLSNELGSTDIFAERPNNPPDVYYIIEKTAAGESNHIQMATIAVQSISKNSLLEAAQMSKAAEAAMRNITKCADISSCKLNSAYNFTDAETREYRYQAVFDIYYVEGE